MLAQHFDGKHQNKNYLIKARGPQTAPFISAPHVTTPNNRVIVVEGGAKGHQLGGGKARRRGRHWGPRRNKQLK